MAKKIPYEEKLILDRTVHSIITMVKKSLINFDQAYQREYIAYLRRTWQRKLIGSVIQGKRIPILWFRVLKELNYELDCIDGQQRSMTFVEFEDDKFKTMSGLKVC